MKMKDFKNATKKQKLIALGVVASLGIIILGVGLGVGLSDTASNVIHYTEGTYWKITTEKDSSDATIRTLRVEKEVKTEEDLNEIYDDIASKNVDLNSFGELLLPYHLKDVVNEEKVKEALHISNFNTDSIGYILHKEDYGESVAIEQITNGTKLSGGYKDQKLVEINLPGYINELPSYAFSNNKIRKVNWSELVNLESLGDSSFFNNKLTGDLDLSVLTLLKTIGDSSFNRNTLSGTLTLPPNITNIGKESFNSSNQRLNKIKGTLKLPKSLESIGSNAFYDNEIEVLDWSEAVSLVDIQDFAFALNKLKTLQFSTTIPPKLKEIKGGAFFSNPGLNKDNEMFINDFTLPPSLQTIGANAIKIKSGINITTSSNASGINDASFVGKPFFIQAS